MHSISYINAGKRRASAGGPRAGPAGRWHCKQGQSSRGARRGAGPAEAAEPLYLYFLLLPLRPSRKNPTLASCDGCILTA